MTMVISVKPDTNQTCKPDTNKELMNNLKLTCSELTCDICYNDACVFPGPDTLLHITLISYFKMLQDFNSFVQR